MPAVKMKTSCDHVLDLKSSADISEDERPFDHVESDRNPCSACSTRCMLVVSGKL